MIALETLRAHATPVLLFECVAGSHAYGTAVAESDQDLRGIYAMPAAAYLGLQAPEAQVADARNDVVYYSLRRVIELLSAANPNVLELLFMPEDTVRMSSPEMDLLVAQRELFLAKPCVQSHIGYALTQIRKARGQNKWINQPRPEAPPAKEDYCHVIPRERLIAGDAAPCRPLPLKTLGWNLDEFHAASLEHARDGYRLYRYGRDARGVFRDGMLVCESIPLEEEAGRFAGLLFYNEQAWRQALSDHQNYWTWRRERNEARWRQQESGELDYDAKNMMHTVRLLLSGESIVRHGRPMVRFEGEQRALLLNIRAGRFRYDELIDMAQEIAARCERETTGSGLPDAIDAAAANRLLRELTAQWEHRQ
ncbi:nucleotidyltransferase domain-containing protein [Dyella marensis]|uniref:Predicted nucleotidyltransferase n=1 Tax=Dyella marensis TaxID=500610 RepID=A0A1I2K0T8_9GAMM|nr:MULTISPECIES: nucleotidyltransferase domain-containing protein [Dyella]SFF59800.1 Predicted nucleotidyltransferase [Dyella marensis]